MRREEDEVRELDLVDSLVATENTDDHVVELVARSKEEDAIEGSARDLDRAAQVRAPPSGAQRKGLI